MIKVGGSLSEDPATLEALGKAISEIARTHQIVVVPGGGKFADTVRDLDAKFSLPAAVSHRMAILAMDQYGLLLTQLIPDSQVCRSLKDAFTISGTGAVPIFLPATLLLEGDPFTPSWEVTSDSIAAYIANQLDAPKVVFATDVDGIFTQNPKQNPNAKLLNTVSARELLKFGQHTSVDTFLPQLLLEHPLDCFVVNGKFPDRLKAVLAEEPTVCTHIVC
ncbi:MAG: delta 1-pyrroline-5-carboxylate synthetase [Candidatus Bathyarchaeia archaeon]